MKRLVLGITFLMILSSAVFAEEKETLGLEAGLDFYSRYYWRGYDFNHGDPVLQPWTYYEVPYVEGLWIETFFSIGFGKSVARGDTETTLDEAEGSIHYRRELGIEDLFGQATLIGTANVSDLASGSGTDDYDFELIFILSYEAWRWIQPYLLYSRGFSFGIEGDYIEVGGMSEVPLIEEKLWLSPKLQIGTYTNQYEVGHRFAHMTLRFPLTYSFDSFSIIPEVLYAWIPKNQVFGTDREHLVVAGASVSYAF